MFFPLHSKYSISYSQHTSSPPPARSATSSPDSSPYPPIHPSILLQLNIRIHIRLRQILYIQYQILIALPHLKELFLHPSLKSPYFTFISNSSLPYSFYLNSFASLPFISSSIPQPNYHHIRNRKITWVLILKTYFALSPHFLFL